MADLSGVVATGDRRAALEALRDRIAVELDGAEGRDVATLSRELRLVLAELESLPGSRREVSTVADLSARIAARRQAPAG